MYNFQINAIRDDAVLGKRSLKSGEIHCSRTKLGTPGRRICTWGITSSAYTHQIQRIPQAFASSLSTRRDKRLPAVDWQNPIDYGSTYVNLRKVK
ncbi:hypothetical protein PGT21_006564 [Puccinia graminis f. sp. tritici]|uniref:Uncharacterized protein n=1 Tax=Puccinia graminis f. sp. tritici TaxID=56615 RepID=A0A5B0MUZ0_PUCGR|nr:hypothetical protein PGT21_006564 [Puccinia graminis f. sp. tritici]KAA1120464.1 hypothetical protein PGTUg99_021321 [Puccinia graminis f. sp. tritici]